MKLNRTKLTYALCGFIWGIPIPIFSTLIFLDATAQELNITQYLQLLKTHPYHILFLLHPPLFSIVFYIFSKPNIHHKKYHQKHIQKLKELAFKDQLTKLHNREYFYQHARIEAKRAERENEAIYILMFDIDKFKHVNDTYGHSMGDQVLKKIALDLKELSRPYDIIARWGGEEFIALLPHSSAYIAKLFAERVRETVQETNFKHKQAIFHCTISCGISEYRTEDSLNDQIEKADLALYEAKNTGRNKSILYTENKRALVS